MLSAITVSSLAGSASANGAKSPTPALLTNTSTSGTSATTRSTAPASARSIASTRASPNSAATSRSRSPERATSTRSWSAASTRAISRPMPPDAPVTSAVVIARESTGDSAPMPRLSLAPARGPDRASRPRRASRTAHRGAETDRPAREHVGGPVHAEHQRADAHCGREREGEPEHDHPFRRPAQEHRGEHDREPDGQRHRVGGVTGRKRAPVGCAEPELPERSAAPDRRPS